LAKNYFRLESLFIDVYENNPLIAILQKQGFITEAIERDYVKTGGQYLARHLMSCDLTKEDS